MTNDEFIHTVRQAELWASVYGTVYFNEHKIDEYLWKGFRCKSYEYVYDDFHNIELDEFKDQFNIRKLLFV